MPEQKIAVAGKPLMLSASATRLFMARLPQLSMPRFTPEAIQPLQGNPAAVVSSEDGKQWCGLAGWLKPPGEAVVQCRRSGLTIRLDKQAAVSAAVLPFEANSPAASLTYLVDGRPAPPRPMQVSVDTAKGCLQLGLAFAKPDEFGEVLAAMTTPAANAAIEVTYSHDYEVKQPPPPPEGEIRVRPRPDILRAEPRVRPGVFVAQPHLMRAEPIAARPAVAQPVIAHAAVARPAFDMAVLADKRTAMDVRKALGADARRIWIKRPPPPQGDRYVDGTYSAGFRIELKMSRDDAAVFPDLPRLTRNGWGQVPRNPRLYFCDSESPDTFYYLPCLYKLGFYSDPGSAGAEGLPPLRVEMYRSEAGEDRVRATLVAIPTISDAEREELRRYLVQDVIRNLQPFVYLEMKRGLEARFTGDFTSGAAADAAALPVNIRFDLVESAAHEKLVLRFDMPAMLYSVFCEMLRKKIQGRLQLSEKNFEAAVKVELELDEVVTNLVNVTEAAEDAQPRVSVANPLPYPVEISSVAIHYLDVGEQFHMVYEAESQRLPATRLETRGSGGETASFPLGAQRMAAWDNTVLEPGMLSVQAGTAQEWLDRVHRDPSMQPYDFRVQVNLSVPPSGRDRVQLVRAKLLKLGDPAVRSQVDLLPSAASQTVPVRVRLEELMGSGGRGAAFAFEYETLYTDETFSLPQRKLIDLDRDNILLRALVEPPGCTYTVESESPSGTERTEAASRQAAAQLIDRLRREGRTWDLFAKAPAPVEPVGPTPPDTPLEPVPETPRVEVGIVTDLLEAAFASGKVKKAFVVLTPAGGAQSSFVYQAGALEPKVWRPREANPFPYRFEITYLYTNGQTREVNGSAGDATLILDPPDAG